MRDVLTILQKGLSGRRTALAPFPRRLDRCFCRLAPSPFCVTGAQGASWPHVAPFSLYKRCGSWSVYLCLDDSPISTHLSDASPTSIPQVSSVLLSPARFCAILGKVCSILSRTGGSILSHNPSILNLGWKRRLDLFAKFLW